MENNTQIYKTAYRRGSVIIAAISILAILVALFIKPSFVLLGHTLIVTEGIVVPAIFLGGLIWAMIEMTSTTVKKSSTLIYHALGGYLLGAIIGGFLGFYFAFGQYLLIPAFHGNIGAIYELFAIFFAFVLFVWSAAWASSKDFKKNLNQ